MSQQQEVASPASVVQDPTDLPQDPEKPKLDTKSHQPKQDDADNRRLSSGTESDDAVSFFSSYSATTSHELDCSSTRLDLVLTTKPGNGT